MKRPLDVAIIGGGLSGCLTFYFLKKFHPQLQIELFEKNSILGGNHTWCFHETDVPNSLYAELQALISHQWSGYDVHFPKYSRSFDSKYFCIRSEDLHRKLMAEYSADIHLNFTADEKFHDAASVIWATGWSSHSSQRFGYQKFVGLDVELEEPHGLTRARLKDARVAQKDGYRFFYCLPWNSHSLLIEDTYYSNHAELNLTDIKSRILEYASSQGWKIKKILREEVGSLPLSLYADTESLQKSSVGARSGYFQPVTGYTTPFILKMSEELISLKEFSQSHVDSCLRGVQFKNSQNLKYYRLLNRMMFLAAEPEKRYQILERFYGLEEGLIQRMYAGSSTMWDRVRILAGKPPIPILRALKALKGTS